MCIATYIHTYVHMYVAYKESYQVATVSYSNFSIMLEIFANVRMYHAGLFFYNQVTMSSLQEQQLLSV